MTAPGCGVVFGYLYYDNQHELPALLMTTMAKDYGGWQRGNGILMTNLPPYAFGMGDLPPSQGPEDNRLWVEFGYAGGMYFGRRDIGIYLHTTITFTILDLIAPIFAAEELNIVALEWGESFSKPHFHWSFEPERRRGCSL